MNETLQTIANRYSCRGYANIPIEQEKIEAIVKAGLQAPSALNIQPWHIVAITDKELIDAIDDAVMEDIKKRTDQSAYERIMERGGKPYYNAPVMFLVLKKADGASAWADLDCGIVVQNMSLAASSLNLGNVIAAMAGTAFTGELGKIFKPKVNWPPGYAFATGLLVGYPETTKPPHDIDLSKVTYI